MFIIPSGCLLHGKAALTTYRVDQVNSRHFILEAQVDDLHLRPASTASNNPSSTRNVAYLPIYNNSSLNAKCISYLFVYCLLSTRKMLFECHLLCFLRGEKQSCHILILLYQFRFRLCSQFLVEDCRRSCGRTFILQ